LCENLFLSLSLSPSLSSIATTWKQLIFLGPDFPKPSKQNYDKSMIQNLGFLIMLSFVCVLGVYHTMGVFTLFSLLVLWVLHTMGVLKIFSLFKGFSHNGAYMMFFFTDQHWSENSGTKWTGYCC
jgi:hypothetical protein